MRVNRTFLYAGVFLLTIGLVLVAADLDLLDPPAVLDALALWPVVVIALGAGLLLRRTSVGLPAGVLAAVGPGLVLGGAFASVPDVSFNCGRSGQNAVVASERGSFGGPATVSLDGACGTFRVDTVPGVAWQIQAANTDGEAPDVRVTDTALSISTPDGGDDWGFLGRGRDEWSLTLPTTEIADLAVDVNAGEGVVNLEGANVGHLRLAASAGRVVVDAQGAELDTLSGDVSFGALSIVLPAASTLTGTLEVGAGELRLCAPPELGLRVTTDGEAHDIRAPGLARRGSTWETTNYASAAHRADLTVDASFGGVEVNPIGGCR